MRASLDARGASFEVFANVSSRFKEGRLSGAAYLAKVTAMGLEAEHVKELASLMPDEALRLELRRAIAAGERARARKRAKRRWTRRRRSSSAETRGARADVLGLVVKNLGLPLVHVPEPGGERAVRRVRRRARGRGRPR